MTEILFTAEQMVATSDFIRNLLSERKELGMYEDDENALIELQNFVKLLAMVAPTLEEMTRLSDAAEGVYKSNPK